MKFDSLTMKIYLKKALPEVEQPWGLLYNTSHDSCK